MRPNFPSGWNGISAGQDHARARPKGGSGTIGKNPATFREARREFPALPESKRSKSARTGILSRVRPEKTGSAKQAVDSLE
jgi:hypothetical protein